MGAAAAVLLLVLGDVEEVGKEAEGAHHVQRLLEVERVQQRLELRLAALLAPEGDRRLADALDALEHPGARLLADHLAQQPPEEAPVFPQQILLGFRRVVPHRFHVKILRRRINSSNR